MSARVAKKKTASKAKKQPKGIVLTPQQKKRQRERSIAIALSLGVLVILFFAVTMVKGPAVLTRPI
ncbi:MAG: CoxF protein [Afipia sp.]|nr:CoxF protein [Afipia sp.]